MIKPFDDTYFMRKALQEAEAAYEKGEIPVGAIIVVEDRIIPEHTISRNYLMM